MSLFKDCDYSDTAEINDRIRAYDFAPCAEHGVSYLEGRVVAKGPINHPVNGQPLFDGYTIEIDRRLIGGIPEEVPEGEKGFVPFTAMMDFEGRVTRLD